MISLNLITEPMSTFFKLCGSVSLSPAVIKYGLLKILIVAYKLLFGTSLNGERSYVWPLSVMTASLIVLLVVLGDCVDVVDAAAAAAAAWLDANTLECTERTPAKYLKVLVA